VNVTNSPQVAERARGGLGLNLFNFVINLNRELRAQGREIVAPPALDFDGISEGDFGIEPLPSRWHNFIDLQTAIELFTPVYQMFLSDRDFWRATNSLQLDETIGAGPINKGFISPPA